MSVFLYNIYVYFSIWKWMENFNNASQKLLSEAMAVDTEQERTMIIEKMQQNVDAFSVRFNALVEDIGKEGEKENKEKRATPEEQGICKRMWEAVCIFS